MSTPVRERNVKAPFSIRASARTPSHLISKSQLGSEKGRSVSVASMGSTRDGIEHLRAPCNSAARIGLALRLGGSSSLISSSVRPVRTEPSCSSMFQAESSAASLCFIISHSLPFSLCLSLTKTKLPRSFSPFRLNLISSRSSCFCASRVPSMRKRDRKSTRLNSSHSQISYAVFCLKKKTQHREIWSSPRYHSCSNQRSE